MVSYQKGQVDDVLSDKDEYGFHLKIHSTNKETKWMLITESQLKKIRQILN